MRQFIYIFAGCVIGILTSCREDYFDWDNGCISPHGPIAQVEFFLPYFDEIRLEDNVKVILRYGDILGVWAEGAPNVIDQLDLQVRGQELRIRTHHCIEYTEDLVVIIVMPFITSIHNRASGIIYGENMLYLDDLEIKLTGSGTIDLAVQADDLEVDLLGSGTLYLEGRGDDLELRSEGSGEFQAYLLTVDDADVRSYGSGRTYLRVLDYLKVRIFGSGSVYFKGYPQINSSINGSGRLWEDN